MSNLIDPELASAPVRSAIQNDTATLSSHQSPERPHESANMEATDSHFGLPTSYRAPPLKNPTTENDRKDASPRVKLNRAMGIDPADRRSVQIRRKEVSMYCQTHYGFTLDTPYTQWSPITWRQLVNAVHQEFRQRYAWTRDTCEEVMKSICSDTSQNIRSSLRRAAKTSGTELPPVQHQKRKKIPQTKTLLRKVRGSKVVSHSDRISGDNAALHNQPHVPLNRPSVPRTTLPNTALQMPQPLAADNPPLRTPPSHDSQSVTAYIVAQNMVNNQHTTSPHISASQSDCPSIAHDTAQSDSISPEIISDRGGINETAHSNVRYFHSDALWLMLI